jgi:hypothetical protein
VTLAEAVFQVSLTSPSMRILLPYVAVALTLLVTVFHHTVLKKRHGDARGMWLYFLLFFLLLAVVPVLILAVVEVDPLTVLAGLGVSAGNYRMGLILMLAALPAALLLGLFGSREGELKRWYPFSKQACRTDRSFVAYELGYLLLYYTAWEFLYRGLLFFPLLSSAGFLPAAAITAILSTMHHIGHPRTEVISSLAAGFIFAAIALLARSVLYCAAIHAAVGISTDTFIYLRDYRRARGV